MTLMRTLHIALLLQGTQIRNYFYRKEDKVLLKNFELFHYCSLERCFNHVPKKEWVLKDIFPEKWNISAVTPIEK